MYDNIRLTHFVKVPINIPSLLLHKKSLFRTKWYLIRTTWWHIKRGYSGLNDRWPGPSDGTRRPYSRPNDIWPRPSDGTWEDLIQGRMTFDQDHLFSYIGDTFYIVSLLPFQPSSLHPFVASTPATVAKMLCIKCYI